MEHLEHKKAKLLEEIRILKKIANARKVATGIRSQSRGKNDDLVAECIESLVREIERLQRN